MAEEPKETTGSQEEEVSRRKFISLVGWGGFTSFSGLSALATARFFYPKILYEPELTFFAGRPDDYPPPSTPEGIVVDTRWLRSQRVWVIRNAQGIYAIAAVCTHLGCTPGWFGDEEDETGVKGRGRFKCPCHGSNFNREGHNIAGPAPEPLYRVPIGLSPDGRLIVGTGLKGIRLSIQTNKADARVKPPFFLPAKV